MTVISIGHGSPGTHNVIIADSVVGTVVSKGLPKPNCERPKLQGIGGDVSFASVLGDEIVLHAAANMALWAEPRVLNWRDPATMRTILIGAERLHQVHLKKGHKFGGVRADATFVVCSREHTFYWHAPGSGEHVYAIPTGPYEIAEGKLAVFYGGGEPILSDFTTDESDPFAMAIERIKEVDAEARRAKRGSLPYELTDRFDRAVLPHDRSRPYRRLFPFRNLPDMWAKAEEGPGRNLISDARFRDFPEF